MWNLGKPEQLLRVEPLCGTLRNLVPGGGCHKPPLSALLEEPQAFRSLGKTHPFPVVLGGVSLQGLFFAGKNTRVVDHGLDFLKTLGT